VIQTKKTVLFKIWLIQIVLQILKLTRIFKPILSFKNFFLFVDLHFAADLKCLFKESENVQVILM